MANLKCDYHWACCAGYSITLIGGLMGEELRTRSTVWRVRLTFAAVLLVFSELIVWQTPGAFSAVDWLGIGLVYAALAAVMLDLTARFNVGEVFSIFLLAGIYGLLNATLISGITTRDLPLSLIVRPLSAQPLVFMAAVGAFQWLASGRAVRPAAVLAAAATGLVWGVWVRWFPLASEDPVPVVEAGTALLVVGGALIVLLVLRAIALRPSALRHEDWLLRPLEWLVASGVLAAALALALQRDRQAMTGLPVVAGLLAFLAVVLYATRTLRVPAAPLASAAGRANVVAWLALSAAFLVAGWVGLHLPGSGDASTQSDLLFGALTGFGILWPPAVASLIGVQAWVHLTRRGL